MGRLRQQLARNRIVINDIKTQLNQFVCFCHTAAQSWLNRFPDSIKFNLFQIKSYYFHESISSIRWSIVHKYRSTFLFILQASLTLSTRLFVCLSLCCFFIDLIIIEYLTIFWCVVECVQCHCVYVSVWHILWPRVSYRCERTRYR